MNCTVLICTFEREDELAITLDSLSGQTGIPAGWQWEVVVVDNAASGSSREVCSAPRPYPLRYLVEPRAGKSHALNTGIAACTSRWILLTDDDVTVPADWVASYIAGFESYPDAAFFGGPVKGQLPDDAPCWARDNPDKLLFLPRYDQGIQPRTVGRRGEVPWFLGANMAYQRALLNGVTRFEPAFGPLGKFGEVGSRMGGEESIVIGRLLDGGYGGVYLPSVGVVHRDGKERLTLRYAWWFYTGYGREEIVHQEQPGSVEKEHVRAATLIRSFAGGIFYKVLRWRSPGSRWYPCFVQAAQAWGGLRAVMWERRGVRAGETGGRPPE